MTLSLGDLNYLINHVFLPPRLPQEHDADSPRKDGVLLNFVARTAQTFRAKLGSSGDGTASSALQAWLVVIDMLEKASHLHGQQYLIEKEVETALLGMRTNECQNAVVIFRKIQDDCLTFEHFEAMLPTEVVMKKSNKIQMRFPSNPRLPVAFKPDIMASLANTLAYFSSNEIDDALPNAKKGGSEHHEIRNVASLRYISEAVAGVLRATQPTDAPRFQTTCVTKRLDDHVLWKSTLRPWRRSPIWLLIRVAIQTTLSEYGVADEVGYKAFQTFFMANILRNAVSIHPNSFTLDLLYFMNAKLARRLAKMGKCIEDDANNALKISGKVVEETSDTLKRRWGQVITQWEDRIQWTPPSPTAFEGCLNLSFANSQRYLREVVNRIQSLNQSVSKFDKAATEKRLQSACPPRPLYTSERLPASILRAELDVSLLNFESWVKDSLQEWTRSPSRTEHDCAPLSQLIDEYRDVASIHYKDDPEDISSMHLCILELWVSLDSLVATWCPLLLDYSPEIPSNYLDPLLLPYSEQVQRLNRVQEYLQKRHQKAILRSNRSLLKDFDAPHSFANRFFGLSIADPLRQLKAEIQAWAAQRRSNKIEELDRLNTEHQALLRQAEEVECLRPQLTKKQHKKQCPKCTLKAAALGLRIAPIEEPLPEDSEQANGIVFELRCPQPIAAWRDAVTRILQIDNPDENLKPELHFLSRYDPLHQFFRSAYSSHRICIASSSKPISMSHYGDEKPVPAIQNQVILKNAGHFALFDALRRQWIKVGEFPDLKPQSTLRLEDAYKSLQLYVDSTLHTSNEVIAAQYQCPIDMSMDEYMAFGQLRSGDRLQWRNIARALRTQSLNFSECSVYFLILQAIWQAGPMDVDSLHRRRHSDIMDQDFCEEVLKELQHTLHSMKDNWTQGLFLACIVALTLRIHNFVQSEVPRRYALTILMEVRHIAFGWMSALRKSFSEQRRTNDQRKRALIAASLVLRSTFDTETRGNSRIFSTDQDIIWYLYAGVVISGQDVKSLPSGIQLLAHRDRRISWRLYPQLSKICAARSMILHQVVSLKWDYSISGSSWIPLTSPGERWWCSTIYQGTKEQQVVHLNIIDGTLLVQGRTFDRLPADYMNHLVYKTLFTSEVTPFFSCSFICILKLLEGIEDIRYSRMKGMDYEGHYHGHEVHLLLKGQDLIIRHRQDRHVEEFIPSHVFKGDLPSNLIDVNHHWYLEGSKTIEIRAERRAWSLHEPRTWRINLNIGSKLISGRCSRTLNQGLYQLVDPHSQIYRHFNVALQALEPQPDGIVITVGASDAAIDPTIYLPRHDLTFSLVSSLLECQSFPGFVVDASYRKVGTLVGLQTFISLRSKDNRIGQRKILVPKGALSSKLGPYGHPLTFIDVKDARGYFAYEVDDILGRLYGSRSLESDLFLAQLHALSSSPLPDHLTQGTGTSEALQSLSSSFYFSFYSLSTESRSYLDGLASLTPLRTFYPSHLQVMETIKWHSSLPTLSQHPSFLPLVENILNYWRDLENFHSFGDLLDTITVPVGMGHLSARADSRNWVYYHPSRSTVQLKDTIHQPYDCVNDTPSRERERLAFQVAHLSHPSTIVFPLCRTLRNTVTSWGEIQEHSQWQWNDIHRWFPKAKSMGEIWCTLFELCRVAKWPVDFRLVMALSLLGYSGAPFDVLATLMAVSRRPDVHLPICQPHSWLDLTMGDGFDPLRLHQALVGQAIGYDKSDESKIKGEIGESKKIAKRRNQALYSAHLSEQISEIIEELRSQWPTVPQEVEITRKRLLQEPSSYKSSIRSILQRLSQNKAFLQHIDHISTLISSSHRSYVAHILYAPSLGLISKPSSRVAIPTLKDLMDAKLIGSEVSIPLPSMGTTRSPSLECESTTSLDQFFGDLRHLSSNNLEDLYLRNLRESIDALATERTTLNHSETLPSSESLDALLHATRENCITEFFRLRDELLPHNYISKLLGCTGFLPAFTPFGTLQQLSLKNRQNLPEKWKIHLVQYALRLHDAKRAERMVRLHSANRHSYLRLELDHQRKWDPLEFMDWLLIEVDTNFSIRSAQADMAREMVKPSNHLNSIMQLNMGEGKSSTAAQDGAVWLCEPEQLLSLKLLGVDKLLRDQSSHPAGVELIRLQSWLQSNTRDIIDESDDVLHTKQQVIYTIGEQKDLDAAPWRWEVIQRLLSLLSDYLSQRMDKSSVSSIALIEREGHKEAFPFIKDFRDERSDQVVNNLVKRSIIDNEWSIKPTLIDLSLQFVGEDPFPMGAYKVLQEQCPESQSPTLQTLLLLRGILQNKILLHVLKDKRYRVNYGLDLTRSLLAVPYRAKDLPSPRSEFGHPDITILLTCLSYYYGGLDDETIRLTLKQLLKSGTPELTQAKEFPSKLSSSGWDLAARKPNLSTGFSGTNDGRFLLPTTILHTNAKFLSCLLQEENRRVQRYSYDNDSSALLAEVLGITPKPTVILDVGAQVLDRSNREFSRMWLENCKDDPNIKAVVFFEQDELVVMTPDGLVQSLRKSPYSQRLDQCIVYLDDAHTRGTDLRLPDTIAVATLGLRLTKDKLDQCQCILFIFLMMGLIVLIRIDADEKARTRAKCHFSRFK
ncbi:hypothetical protein CPB86DRAFT_800496 [Serendipita vermifera]|nr:hypothetical protein CPB86DRAFT_800496 [Serendipita vermifera]